MHTFSTLSATVAAALLAAAAPSFAIDSPPTRFVEDASRVLDVVGVTESDGAVRGTLVNRSDDVIKDVRLAVSHSFLWNRERDPGPDDPSQATIVTLDKVVPAHGSVPFTVSFDPLPQRRDGHFTTSTEIVSFTSWKYPSGTSAQSAAEPAQRPAADL